MHPLRVLEARKRSDRHRVLTTRAILITAVGLLFLTVGLILLLDAHVRTAPVDATKNRLEAIKVALSIGVGSGGFVALLLAARKQQVSEKELKQREKIHEETKTHQERVASSTELDSAIRRSSEAYTKAVEQLGSERAAVRLGGLYALARLGDENPQLRQTVINVWCAYLRMPFGVDDHNETQADELSPTPSQSDTPWMSVGRAILAQEKEVRATAQRLIEERLSDPTHVASIPDARPSHWSDMDLDLNNAIVLHLDLSRCTVRHARFIGTHFAHGANLSSAKFESATFSGSYFAGYAWFDETVIRTIADFTHVTFSSHASFVETQFGHTEFNRTEFMQGARFDKSCFMARSSWDDCDFKKEVSFNTVTFNGPADFDTTMFSAPASFKGSQFAASATFWNSGVMEGMSLAEVSFYDNVSFPDGDLNLQGAHVHVGSECANVPETWVLRAVNPNWRLFHKVDNAVDASPDDTSSSSTLDF